jgi:16S rRNA processing protein RimM
MANQYISIGKFVATFGVKGQLVLEHDLGEGATLEGIEAVFIEENSGSFIPHFLESHSVKSHHEFHISLEGLDSPEKAKKFVRKNVWLLESDAKKKATPAAPLSLLGYTVIDHKKALGVVLEVIEQTNQLLFRIEIEGKEVLLPVNESTLQKIDHKKERIFLTLPEGLLEIYLN